MRVAKFMVLVMCLVTVGTAWAYATWQEAMTAADVKWTANNFAGARADYQAAILLATDSMQKSQAQLKVGISYRDTGDYANAVIEFEKVESGWPRSHAREQAGWLAKENIHDNIRAKNNFFQCILTEGAIVRYIDSSWEGITQLKLPWTDVISGLSSATSWAGYYYLAVAQDKNKQVTGALASCDAAFDLLKGKEDEVAIAAKKRILTLRGDIAWRAKDKSYGDIVSP